MKKILSLILSLLLCLTCSFSLLACQPTAPADTSTTALTTSAGAARTGVWESATYLNDTELGVGAKTISVLVSAEGQTVVLTIHTDAANLGDALYALGLINDASFFDTANGIKADWSVNESWWQVLNADDTQTSGINVTPISGGELFKLVYTIGF